MGDRDWKDEQRSALIRFSLNRGKASDEGIEADIHRLAAANRRLEDEMLDDADN
jgi:hypothetical protein